MSELTQHVERVVRPVWAGASRKRRMRQELSAHLTAAYEEERARLGDDRVALNLALARFGDPAELTRELQAAVPWWERVLFARTGSERYDRRARAMMFGTGPSPRRDAVLLAGLFAALTFALLMLLPLAKVADGTPWSAARVAWDVTGVLTAHAFVSGLLCLGYIRAVGGPPRTATLARAASWGAAVVLWGATFVPAMAAAKPDDPLWAELLRSPGRFAVASVGWWVFLVVLAVVSRYVDARQKRAGDEALPTAE